LIFTKKGVFFFTIFKKYTKGAIKKLDRALNYATL